MSDSLGSELEAVFNASLEYPGREALLFNRDQCHGAAVAVLFCGKNFLDSSVLLIERSQEVLTHKGQVAFPGGSVDPRDQGDLVVTALRECEEEVGLSREWVRVVGALPPFPTLSGNFCVVPVLGFVPDDVDIQLQLQKEEVAGAEWVPVQSLLESRFYQDLRVSGVMVKAPEFRWGERRMWGLSAWILDLILRRHLEKIP